MFLAEKGCQPGSGRRHVECWRQQPKVEPKVRAELNPRYIGDKGGRRGKAETEKNSVAIAVATAGLVEEHKGNGLQKERAHHEGKSAGCQASFIGRYHRMKDRPPQGN